MFCGFWNSRLRLFWIVGELHHLPVLDKAGLLLFERSGANLGIRMSWKPNVTVHLPCISILTPQTSHQTSPSKSSARADSHAATARTSVEFWQPALVCVHVCAHSPACVCVRLLPPDSVWDLTFQPTLTLTQAVFGQRATGSRAACYKRRPCRKQRPVAASWESAGESLLQDPARKTHKPTARAHTCTHSFFSVFVALK